jgi:hypothetical protein
MTYTLIDSEVLASAAASVTFSSIPADYRDLVLVFNGSTTFSGLGQLQLVYNSNTGDVYKRVNMTGNGSSADSGGGSNSNVVVGNTNNTTLSLSIIQIMDYSATDKHKTSLIRNNNSAINTEAAAVRFESTSVITSILAQTNATSFAAGSTFYLYAIES